MMYYTKNALLKLDMNYSVTEECFIFEVEVISAICSEAKRVNVTHRSSFLNKNKVSRMDRWRAGGLAGKNCER